MRDVSSSSAPSRPTAAAPVDAGGRFGSQANGYQSMVSASPASSGTAASDWAASRNKDTWNSSRVRCYIIITAA